MGKKKSKQQKKPKQQMERKLDKYAVQQSGQCQMYLGYDPDVAPSNIGMWNRDHTDWVNNYGIWYGIHGEPEPTGSNWCRTWYLERIETARSKSAYKWWLWKFMQRHQDVATPDLIMDPPSDWHPIDFESYLHPAGFEWTNKEYKELTFSIIFFQHLASTHGWFAFVKS